MDFDDGMFGEVASARAPEELPATEQPDFFSVESIPVDLPAAISRFDEDREFVLQILDDYRAQLPQRVQEIRQLLHAGDSTSLCRIAHNLKGVSLNISADPIAQAALGIEQSALREDLKSATDHLTRLEVEVERFNDYLSRMNA